MAAQPGVVMVDESGRRRSRATLQGDFEGGGREVGGRKEGVSGYGPWSLALVGLSAFVSSSAWQAIGGRA